MTFELGKQYIVEVTKNGIIHVEEFKREKFFDKDHDSLDFLTDEEKTIVINDVLDKIRTEIKQKSYGIANDDVIQGMKYERRDILDIIDKYKEAESKILENEISESEETYETR